jgi:hypothetical protein
LEGSGQKRLTSLEALGQAQLSSQARLPDSSIADGTSPTRMDGPMLKQTVQLTQLGSSPIPRARGISLHTKKKGDTGAKQT